MSWIRHKHCLSTRAPKGQLGKHRERLSLQAHLAWCELKLRSKTKPGQLARRRLLDLLHGYWRAGRFPQNPEQTGGRQPVFIDNHGIHCAVGYLMAQTGAKDLAKEINQRDRFVYLETIDLSRELKIKRWLIDNELEPDEAALIQPSYGCGPGDWDFQCPSHTYTGLSGGDIVIAIASIIFSLVLLLPTVSLIFLIKRPFPEKFGLFLQRLGCLILLAIPGLIWVANDANRLQSGERFSLFVAVNVLAWPLLLGLLGSWLVRWRQGRPMFGFDQAQNRYRPGMRFLFYILATILLLGSLYAFIFQAKNGPAPDYYIYLNLLALVSLPFLLAHRPFQGIRPKLSRSLVGGFLTSILVLAFLIPSPIYTFDQLVAHRGGGRGGGVSCEPGANFDRRALSCWEITGGLPKLISPNTWQDDQNNPDREFY